MTPCGDTVTLRSSLLLSLATGIFQLAVAVELRLILARMSEGQLKNTGGITSAINNYTLTYCYCCYYCCYCCYYYYNYYHYYYLELI